MIARYLGKYIPGNPDIIVQNMPGAGAMIAANYVYKVAKPDGLTLGGLRAGLYFDQLVGKKEVQFDWSKFTWLGTPTQIEQLIYIRANSPYKTIQDVRKAAVPPKCGASGTASTGYYFGNLTGGNHRRKIQYAHRLQRWTRSRPGRRARRGPLPRHLHRNHVRARTADRLVQEWFCPRTDTDRKKTRPEVIGRSDHLGTHERIQDSGRRQTSLDDHPRGRRVWPAVRCVPEHAAGPRKNPSKPLFKKPSPIRIFRPKPKNENWKSPRRAAKNYKH